MPRKTPSRTLKIKEVVQNVSVRPKLRRVPKQANREASATRSVLVRNFLQQIRSPFTATELTRGPYCGQATGLFSLRQRQQITVGAGTVYVLLAQPNYYTGFHWIYAAGAPAAIPAAASFSTVGTWPSDTVAASLYPESRCIGGGMRIVNTTQTLNVAGTILSGFLPADTFTAGATGALSLPTTYGAFAAFPTLSQAPPAEPVEILHSLGASGGYNIDEFTGLGITTTIANILNGSQPTGFLCIVINNLSANALQFSVEVVFHYEGIGNQAYLNFIPLEISRMTFAEFEACMIQESVDRPLSRVRQGQPALDDCDGWCQLGKAGSSLLGVAKETATTIMGNEAFREAAAAGIQHLTAQAATAAGRSFMAKNQLRLRN